MVLMGLKEIEARLEVKVRRVRSEKRGMLVTMATRVPRVKPDLKALLVVKVTPAKKVKPVLV